MSQENNIDKHFSEALKDRVASGYAESAWLGAEALLNAHYRKLFWRKMFLGIGAVALLLGVVGWWFAPNLILNNIEIDGPQNEPEISVTNISMQPTAASENDNDNSNVTDSSVVVYHSIQVENDANGGDNSESDDVDNDIRIAISNENTAEIFSDRSNLTGLPQNHETSRPKLEFGETAELDKMPIFKVGVLSIGAKPTIENRTFSDREPLMKHLRKLHLAARVGGLFAFGFQNVMPSRDPLTLGWFAGLEANFHINARWYIQAGITASSRGSLATTKTQPVAPGLVQENIAQRLIYADIPVGFGYRFGARHAISFAMSICPLIGYSQSEETFVVGENRPVSSNFTTMNRAGFAGFDMAGTLSYALQLNSRFDALAEMRYGLFDLTDNALFGTELVDDRNHQLRLGLRYRLINR